MVGQIINIGQIVLVYQFILAPGQLGPRGHTAQGPKINCYAGQSLAR